MDVIRVDQKFDRRAGGGSGEMGMSSERSWQGHGLGAGSQGPPDLGARKP